jgi:hypothetical protein
MAQRVHSEATIDSRVTMKASFMWMLNAKEYREMMRRRR